MSPTVEPITAPCPTPLGSSDELLSTPRADSNLELLALELEPGRVTASQGTYDRVVADLAAMRARAPSLDDIYFSPPHDGRTLDVELTENAILAVSAGAYPAWDCLGEAYGAEISWPIDFFGGFILQVQMRGIYDLPRIAELYRQLPGVLYANPSSSGGGPPPLCAARDGNIYEYVVDRASARCETTSTCNQHRARHYVSDAPGQVTALEVWDSETGDPAPEWYVALCR